MKSIVLIAAVLRIIIMTALIGLTIFASAQSVAVNANGNSADASAMLDVSSATKGFLAPRMSTAERASVVSPAIGLLVFDTSTRSFWYFSNEWKEISNAASPVQNIWTKNGDSIYTVSSTGKVGIGTNAPAEKLDVIGNINMQGNLKVNGTNGQSGQILTTNSAGETVWADGSYGNCGYRNVMRFAANTTWVIPDSISNIMIEAWGAGGGGAPGGGGGSGAYLRRLNVSTPPGTSVQVLIGTSGGGAPNNNSNAAPGGNTTINMVKSNGVLLYTFTIQGGGGATTWSPGHGGVQLTPHQNAIFINGSNGEPTTENYYQLNTIDFVTVRKYGNGANAAYLNYGGGHGGFLTLNTGTQGTIKSIGPTSPTGPGAGGSPGLSLYTKGSAGLVQIWY
jgi:hypothetical protein